MTCKNLQIVTEQEIAVITVNRPAAMNALNEETLVELLEVFGNLATDDSVQVIILTGSGEKAFVAGADIGAMQPFSALEARSFAKLGHRVMHAIESCPKPVIAAVNGFALGGGCELALSCDIRIVAENGKFGQPEVNLGIIPGFGGTQRLARIIGKGRALELILTGEMIDSEEAYRIGLANKIVTQEQLLSSAKQWRQR